MCIWGCVHEELKVSVCVYIAWACAYGRESSVCVCMGGGGGIESKSVCVCEGGGEWLAKPVVL